MKKTLGIFIFAIILLFSCQKPKDYSPIPVIDFTRLIVRDTTDQSELHNKIVLYQIYFKVLDGDNDLGIDTSDSTAQDSTNNNLFFTLLYKKNGKFDTAQMPIPLDFRIPKAQYVSIYNYLKATVIANLTFDPNILSSLFDTIKFSFYVIDQAHNRSNIQETPEIPVNFRGVMVDTDTIIR